MKVVISYTVSFVFYFHHGDEASEQPDAEEVEGQGEVDGEEEE